MIINALCTANGEVAKPHCDELIYCGENPPSGCRGVYAPFGTANGGDIYVPTLVGDDVVEEVCDYILEHGCNAIVRAAYDLEEAGLVEAKYKLSPIMLLHRMGVLDRCVIAGGVCLDNDDLDLMAQEGVPLVVTPTASAGYGHGFPPVCAALRRGVRVGIGTFDGKYNKSHDIKNEIEFLTLIANAEMRTENALTEEHAERILRFE
ncbi:MAG: hypothetical protein OSJ83_00720 [Clostridia bacterium]|nr:hypothetical protein [Clostridia bacterium]